MKNGDGNIILIGYRGTGKTSVGRELARRQSWTFQDTDALVEAREGRSIRAMVDREGWAFFRQREKETIRSLSGIRCGIVATGGGAVLDPDNAGVLKSMGWIVLLTAEERVLVRRMLGDPANREQRPSLSGGGSAEASEELMLKETREILAQRMPIYRRLADLVVDTTSATPAEIAEEILRCFALKD